MGLDLALGGLVLFSAFRGWVRGFVVQAIRLCGLLGAIYAAVPLRDQSKPYILEYLPSIRPEWLDRLLFWVAAAVSYFLIVGIVSMIVAVSRKRTFSLDEPNRGDNFAGFGLGVAKGLLASSFLVAGLHKYGESQFDKVAWADEQIKSSYAWKWHEEYHPAAKIWDSVPVQRLVNHVQKNGLPAPGNSQSDKPEPVRTAARTPKLSVSSPDLSEIDAALNAADQHVQKQLSRLHDDDSR